MLPLLLLLLAGLALLLTAALLASRALGIRRLAPTVAASFCIGNAALLAPIHLLGFTRTLSKTSVVASSFLALSIVIAGSLWLLRRRGLVGEARAMLISPFDALRSLKRPLAWPPLLLVIGVMGYAIQAALRLPSDAWDGIWYHETIVGGTLEARGYGVIPLPDGLVQEANGFPRNGEMVGLWLVSLAGRGPIELPNACALAGLCASGHMVAARFAKHRDVAVALACVACLAPGAILQLRSTYVDVYAAAAGAAAIAFLTTAPFRPRDALLGGLGLAIFAGAKSSALFIVPLLLVLLCVRAWQGDSRLRLAAAAAVVITSLSLAGVYLRNALLFENPLYPFAFHLPRLGIEWPGAAEGVDKNASAGELLRAVFLPAPPGRDFADIRRGGYGLAFAWVLLPLSAVGIARALRALHGSLRSRRARIERQRAQRLLGLLALLVPATLLSPALWAARYHLIAVAIAAAPAAHALSRMPRWVAAVAVLSSSALIAVAIRRFDPPLASASDWGMDAAVIAQRERELGPDTVVAFGPGVAFVSQLYNDRFDNRILFVPEDTPRAIEKRLAAASPTWVVASPEEPLYRYVGERSDRWELVGLASRNAVTYAFRRKPAR